MLRRRLYSLHAVIGYVELLRSGEYSAGIERYNASRYGRTA